MTNARILEEVADVLIAESSFTQDKVEALIETLEALIEGGYDLAADMVEDAENMAFVGAVPLGRQRARSAR